MWGIVLLAWFWFCFVHSCCLPWSLNLEIFLHTGTDQI